eukprot:m.207169 g.207169  ORF g.207169 m.207169 type:complete len:356 (+) comp18920_c0_seq2:285-1352(+)
MGLSQPHNGCDSGAAPEATMAAPTTSQLALRTKEPPMGHPLLLGISGGFAGMAAKTAVAPLDRVRILSQTGASKKNFLGTFSDVLRQDGVPGLWRGNAVNCLRVFPAKGVLYMSQDVFKNILRKSALVSPENRRNRTMPTYLSSVAGALAGISAATMTYPLDLVRTRMAGTIVRSTDLNSTNSGKVQRHRIVDTFRRIVHREGFFALYRGLTPTVLGSIPYEGVRFGVYDVMQKRIPVAFKELENGEIYWSLVSGALAGGTASASLFPNDTIRRILQVQGELEHMGSSKQPYRGMLETYRETYRAHGIRRFYRGLGPNLLRVVPNAAIQFGVYEYAKSIIQGLDHKTAAAADGAY